MYGKAWVSGRRLENETRKGMARLEKAKRGWKKKIQQTWGRPEVAEEG